MNKLNLQEYLALKLIFSHKCTSVGEGILSQLNHAKSIYWEETGPGFFSTVKLKKPLTQLPNTRMCDFVFSHPDFPHGGSYHCFIDNDTELELEGVTFGGANWPYPQNIDLFKTYKD